MVVIIYCNVMINVG